MISLSRSEIESVIDLQQAAEAIEEAYRATSRGTVNLPPVGHITFPTVDADCHIKYGHMQGEPTFVIKVATGFPKNADHDRATGNGLVLVMSAETGEVRAVLHDEMMLTDIRTGVGAAIASRLLARSDSQKVLIVGTGPQSIRQIEAHATLLPQALSFSIWGRNTQRVDAIVKTLAATYNVSRSDDLESTCRQSDIIVTATGAKTPVVRSDWITSGTHITAVGADAPGKQELEESLIARADILSVDLTEQCLDHGEISHAAKSGAIHQNDVRELGAVLQDRSLGRTNPEQISITDLTGIAAQDIAMANTVVAACSKLNR